MTLANPPWWRRLPFAAPAGSPAPLPPLPRPDPPVCVIGDVHGCDAALGALLAKIAARPEAARARLILAGDLIDRGPASAAVLARLMALTAAAPERVTCLMGNHEAMCLEALERPAAMTRWLANGGDATLASYGVSARRGLGGGEDAAWHADLVAALRAAWPPGTEAWLRALPLCWQEGGLAVAHAAGDPDRPLAEQGGETLVWGHRHSLRRPRADGLWVVHGHWIRPAVEAGGGRIAVDTGAWRGGPLSAAWLSVDGLDVIDTLG